MGQRTSQRGAVQTGRNERGAVPSFELSAHREKRGMQKVKGISTVIAAEAVGNVGLSPTRLMQTASRNYEGATGQVKQRCSRGDVRCAVLLGTWGSPCNDGVSGYSAGAFIVGMP